METGDLTGLQYTPRQITGKRAEIRKNFIDQSRHINSGEIKRISNEDLELLFQLYDRFFLNAYFKQAFSGRLRFSISTRMTRSAAKTHYPRDLEKLPPHQQEFEIRVGIPFFFNYNQLQREKIVNGIKSKDALDALQLVFEHELVHIVELCCYGKSSCRGQTFKGLAQRLFGHTQSYHHLPTVAEIAGTRFGFQAGSQVTFIYEGKKYRGYISAVNKRATVMVPDKNGPYQNKEGQRFSKWYVPLPDLRLL